MTVRARPNSPAAARAKRQRRRTALGRLLALVGTMFCAATALAQQQPGQGTGGPVTQAQQTSTNPTPPPLYSAPFGDQHLLGDWGGVRTWLESRGIDLGVNYFSETAGIVSGGQRQGVDYTSQIGLSIDLDGDKLLNLPGFALHSVIVERNGRSASADYLRDDLDAVQQIYGGGGDVIASRTVYGTQLGSRGPEPDIQ